MRSLYMLTWSARVLSVLSVLHLVLHVVHIVLQWDFHLGGAAASGGGQALGPLDGVGSGPKVEAMLEAMDSWNGLFLHYRCRVALSSNSTPGLCEIDLVQ